jgi:hypothetical protein
MLQSDSVGDLNLIKLAQLWSQILGQNLVKQTPTFAKPFFDELAPTFVFGPNTVA